MIIIDAILYDPTGVEVSIAESSKTDSSHKTRNHDVLFVFKKETCNCAIWQYATLLIFLQLTVTYFG